MIDTITSLIRRCDFFGYANFLYLNQRSKYKTIYFGLFSLVFILYLLFRFVTGIGDIISSDKETSNINYFKIIDENLENINSSRFPLLINFKVLNLRNKKQIKLNSVFSDEINVKYQNIKTSVFMQKRFNFTDVFKKVEFLKEDEIKGLEIMNYFDFKNKINNEDLYVIDLSKVEFLKNLNNSITIFFHNNDLNKKPENFDVDDIYFSINFINLKVYINNLKLENDFSRKAVENNFFNTNNKKAIDINISKKLIYSFKNKFIQSKQYEKQEILDYSIKETLNNENFFQLNINLNEEIEIFERYFSNINTLLSELGGLLSSFKALGILITFLYEYVYLRNLAEFIFEEKKGNETDSNVNKSFINESINKDSKYLFYKSFVWKMDLCKHFYERNFKNDKLHLKDNHNDFKSCESLDRSNILANEDLKKQVNKEKDCKKEMLIKEIPEEDNSLKHKLVKKLHKNNHNNLGKSINLNDELRKGSSIKLRTKTKSTKGLFDKTFCFKEKVKKKDFRVKDVVQDFLDVKRLLLVSIKNNAFFEFYREKSNQQIGS